MKNAIISFLNKLPHIRGLKQIKDQYDESSNFAPGHFYSPLMDKKSILGREDKIWAERSAASIQGVDFNDKEQVDLLSAFEKYYDELPFSDHKKDGLRYYLDNSFYSYTDAIALYSFIRHFNPKKIIEVGSGFSSAVMLDTRQVFNLDIDLTFIEPYPDRLLGLMTESDKKKTDIQVKNVQEVPLDVFSILEENDILFIDSSHVSKTDSDLNYLLFEVIPSLRKGVIIHFHDIHFPFEYPKPWVLNGFNWNEVYLVRAFLMYNTSFKMMLFSNYMHSAHPESYSAMPLCYKNTGGNLWLRKLV